MFYYNPILKNLREYSLSLRSIKQDFSIFRVSFTKFNLNIFTRLFKDTFIYGLATVLPRLMNLVLVPLHTSTLNTSGYSENTSFYVYAAFANVLLTYGMETSFFRFFNKEKNNSKVFTTVLLSLATTSILFFVTAMFFCEQIALWLKIPVAQLQILAGTLTLDTMVVSAFVLYRIQGKALKFASVKLFTLVVTVFFNFYFLKIVPQYAIELPTWLQYPMVFYIFITNLLASACCFLLVLPTYLKHKIQFDNALVKRMLIYGLPVMVSGIAFVINENLDKLILRDYLGKEIMGAYSGCYKLSVFLTLFIQAFRMGVEPFIFNQAKSTNAKETYATVLKFFVIFASLGMLFVIAFLDIFKELLIPDKNYWKAIQIVPVVLLANWCLGVYYSLSVWYKVTDKTSFGMYISIFGALITIAINYIFVPIHGFMAAAYATLAAYGSMMAISYYYGQRYYKIPYNIIRLVSYLITALALSVICHYIFPKVFIVKLMAILVYLSTIAIFEKNSIRAILKR